MFLQLFLTPLNQALGTVEAPDTRHLRDLFFSGGIFFAPPKPIPSMYGIFTNIWLIYLVNVGKYTIHITYPYMDAMGTDFWQSNLIKLDSTETCQLQGGSANS